MQQRGLTEGWAMSFSVNGLVNDLVREFPMEYTVELKRLIELEMEGSLSGKGFGSTNLSATAVSDRRSSQKLHYVSR